METFRILYLEDNPDDVELLKLLFKKFRLEYSLIIAENENTFVVALERSDIDIILADYHLPGYDGLSALKLAKKKKPDLPFILISGSIGEEKAIEMFKQGMVDFINKKFMERIIPVIQRSMLEVEEKLKRKQAEAALQENEKQFRQFAENMEEVFWRVTPDFKKILYISPAYEIIWQRTCESLYKNPLEWFDPIEPTERQIVIESFSQFSQSNIPTLEIQYNIERPDGTIRMIHNKAVQVKNESGEVINIIGVASDMTEFYLMQKNIDIQHRIRMIFKQHHDLIKTLTEAITAICHGFNWDIGQVWIANTADNTLDYFCSWSEPSMNTDHLIKTSRETRLKPGVSLLGWVYEKKNSIWLNDSEEQTSPIPENVRQLGIRTQVLLPVNFSDQIFAVIELSSTILRKPDPLNQKILDNLCYWLGSFIYYQNLQNQLPKMAGLDSLTNLLNRFSFEKDLAAKLNLKPPLLAIIMINIDRFSEINSAFGNEIGNIVLQRLADKLRTLKKTTLRIGRYGGNEFIISVIDNTIDAVLEKLKKIKEIFDIPFFIAEHEIFLTASMGISLYPQDGTTSQLLISKAELALRAVKKLGGNYFQFFSHELTSDISNQVNLASSLHHALKKNEFILYFQPKVNVKTNKIVGAEALIRWQHPEKGLLLPGVFLPLVEKFGLTIAIGEWTLNAVMSVLKDWQQKQINLPIAINVSANQLSNIAFPDIIKHKIQENNLDSHLLEIEITENSLINTSLASIDTFITFNQLGINVSIDDFGTGYSSFNYLRRFRIASIKIDKSFIDGIPLNVNDAAIVNAILVMAQSLGIKTIAEGVTNKEQLEFLRSKNCDEIQGYYFFQPMTKEQLEAILKK